MSRRRMLLLAVAALVMTSCGIQTDSAPRNLPDSERGPAAAGSSSGSDASGADRIYLVAPGDERLLRSVPRDAALREDLMQILLLGPNDDEIAAQYSSFIPPDTQLLSAPVEGSDPDRRRDRGDRRAHRSEPVPGDRPDRLHRDRDRRHRGRSAQGRRASRWRGPNPTARSPPIRCGSTTIRTSCRRRNRRTRPSRSASDDLQHWVRAPRNW